MHERNRKYRNDNKAKEQARWKEYYKKVKEKEGVSYNTKRMRNNAATRLAFRLRRRLHHALHKRFKKGSAVRDLGMPVDAFLMYLNLDALDKYGIPYTGNERLFHIDHIRPLSSFDLEDPEQLRIAVRWDNLQILSVVDNLAKGARQS